MMKINEITNGDLTWRVMTIHSTTIWSHNSADGKDLQLELKVQ